MHACLRNDFRDMLEVTKSYDDSNVVVFLKR